MDDEQKAEQEASAYALSRVPGEHIRPRDLQTVTKGAVGFNAACRVLETLEKDGELVRAGIPGSGSVLLALVWQRAQPTATPSRGYALPLLPKEHGALLRLLDAAFRLPKPWTESFPGMQGKSDADLLRAIRLRMKRPA